MTLALACVGLDHHTAAVDLRERLAFLPAELPTVLTNWRSVQPTTDAALVVLSTCNRTEVYLIATNHEEALEQAATFLEHTREVSRAQFVGQLYCHVGLDAARHLCRVAAGLESMVLGEPQILGQVAAAAEASRSLGLLEPDVLAAAFQAAVQAGKRARHETAIGRGATSLPAVAVARAEKVAGALGERQVLVVGSGEMAAKALAVLHARGVRKLTLIARNQARAAELGRPWGGQIQDISGLEIALSTADVVVTAAGASEPIIARDALERAVAARAATARDLVVLDLGLPRNVERDARDLTGVRLYDLDDLQEEHSGHLARRLAEVPRVERIVEEELAALSRRAAESAVRPVIAQLRTRADEILQAELEHTLRRFPDLTEAQRETLEAMGRALVNKLLHEPTQRLRDHAANGDGHEVAQWAEHLFGLAAWRGVKLAGPSLPQEGQGLRQPKDGTT